MDREVLKALNILYRNAAKNPDEKQDAYVRVVLAIEEGENAKKKLNEVKDQDERQGKNETAV